MDHLAVTSWTWTRPQTVQSRRRRGRRRDRRLGSLCMSALVFLVLFAHSSAAGADDPRADVSGFGRVYYQSLEDDSSSFYVRRPFLLGYTTAVSDVTWVLPPTCNITTNLTTSGATALAQCTASGASRFGVYADGNTSKMDAFYITFQEDPGCYTWVFGIGGSDGAAPGQLVPNSRSWGYIWAVDWAVATASEKKSMATAPSKISMLISEGLHNLGEEPTVNFLHDANVNFTGIEWLETESIWMVNFTTGEPGLYATEITGKDISVLNCRVRSTKVAIPVLKYLTPYNAMYTSLKSMPAASGISFSIAIDPCAPNVNYVIGGNYIGSEAGLNLAITQLGLPPSLENPNATVLLSLTQLASSLPADANRRIVAVTASLEGASALTSDGNVVHVPIAGGLVVSTFTVVPTAPLTIIKAGLPFCDLASALPTKLNSYVLGWSSLPGTSTLYLSTDGGVHFAPLVYYRGASPVTTNGQLGSGGYIRDVVVNSIFDRITLLVRDAYETTARDRVLSWDIKSSAWVAGYVFPVNVTDHITAPLDAGMKGAKGGLTIVGMSGAEMIAYGDSLFYSPNGGLNFFLISLQSRDRSRPAPGLASDEYIARVATSPMGKFAALTSQNRVFYGKAGVGSAIEILAGLPPTQDATLSFDVLERLRVHTPASEQNGYVVTRVLPVDNQVISPRPPINSNPILTCPYLEWSSNLTSEYVLDVEGRLAFEVSVVPKSGFSNTVSIAFSNSSVISVSTESTEEYVFPSAAATSDYLMRRKSTTVITPRSPGVSGKTNMRVAPSDVSLGCQRVEDYSTIRVACPPARRLVYRSSHYLPASKSSWNCSTLSSDDVPETITLKYKEYISDYSTMAFGPTKDIPYNCSRFGPPTRVYYGDFWRPIFDIYDGDTFVQQVTGDIVLFEQNGKLTFSYNATVANVGCIRPPQTWKSMIATNPSRPFDTWTEDNYAPCYIGVAADISAMASDPYEIISKLNFNAVHWTGNEDGVFVFSAKVLDPNTSFCDLTTEFAVHVYGAPLNAGLQAGIVLGLTAGFMLTLAGSYAWYRREHMMKEKEQ